MWLMTLTLPFNYYIGRGEYINAYRDMVYVDSLTGYQCQGHLCVTLIGGQHQSGKTVRL